jgi:UDP-N-acetyl-2-amino-2-deoxyglucuronate dehydrogenase
LVLSALFFGEERASTYAQGIVRMSSDIGFGLIGCGTMGMRHAECILDTKGVSLRAVYDMCRERAEKVAEDSRAVVVSDAEDLIARPDIQAVVIALPSHLHSTYGILAARAGKHVLVEKPIDLSLTRAEQLIKTCRECNVVLSVVSQHRFHPDVLELKAALEAGKLGKLVLCSAQSEWKRDQSYYEKAPGRGLSDRAEGGVLLNQAVHYIDLLLWLCGPVSRVSGYRATLTHDIAVEDVGAVVVQFKSGALGTITATTSVSPQQPEKLEIHGERGTVIIESGKCTAWHIDGEDAQRPARPSGGEKTRSGEVFKPHLAPVRRQLEDFANAICDARLCGQGKPPLVTGEEGLAVLATILAAYRSADSGRSENLWGV